MLRAPLAIMYAGTCAFEQLDFAAAHRLLEAALIQHRRMGNVHDAATALRSLGELALNERRFDDARSHCAESLRMFRALHDPNCEARTGAVQAIVLCATDAPADALSVAESVVETHRRVGSRTMRAMGLRTLARVRNALGNIDEARRALCDAIEAQRPLERNHALPNLLEAVAGLSPDAAAAPMLLGGAATLRELWRVPLFPAERDEYERSYAAVRAQHGDDDFERGMASGRVLDRHAATDCALALLRSQSSQRV